MTTVAQLIDYLKQFDPVAIVCTNQYGGDWSEEHPIDLKDSTYYPDGYFLMGDKSYLQNTKAFEEYCSDVDDKPVESSDYVKVPIVRLVA